MERWVPLTQYAIEEGISISTLRRKIKSNTISFRLDAGRYLIKSETEKTEAVNSKPITTQVFASASSDAPRVSQPRIAPVVDITT
jgi:hypothetical protein